MTAVVDAIESDKVRGPASEVTPFSDINRLGFLGMSFGASAAVSGAQRDPRVKAAANLDGAHWLSDVLDTDARVPLLVLDGDIRPTLAGMGIVPTQLTYNEFFFERLGAIGLRDDIVRVQIPNVIHMELTDNILLPREERSALPGGGRCESARMTDIMNETIQLFFDHVLLGTDNGYPAAMLERFPELTPITLEAIREWATARAIGN